MVRLAKATVVSPISRSRASAVARDLFARTEGVLVHRGLPAVNFSGRRRKRCLFVTVRGAVPRSQIYPFLFYLSELKAAYDLELREVDLETYERRPERAPRGADVVLLQTWFDIDRARLLHLFETLRQHNPYARFVYFDCFAPTDLRLAEVVADKVDLYVKKHVLRDRTAYGAPTRGDTTLMDYYGNLYGIDHPEVRFPIPEGFLAKLLVGPSFGQAAPMLPHFYAQAEPLSAPKTIDLHGRLGSKGSEWYTRMRRDAIERMDALKDLNVASGKGASRSQYFDELAGSKLCFSPFGFGEVAWRDYEAIMCGALLLKPDMAHCETDPDIFVPFETYVPVRWDFSDLEEKVRYFLTHESERLSIVARAHALLHAYARSGRFIEQMRPLFEAA
jgi:hypothetical protein